MKYLIVLFVVTASVSVAQADSGVKFQKLICSGPDGITLTVGGLGSGQLYVVNSETARSALPRTSDGDCAGRKTYCSQDGQVMTNIPESLASGDRKTGRIWINGDVDDRPENRRLGDAYDCVAAI